MDFLSAKRKIILILVAGVIVFIFFSNHLFAYDETIVHPSLTSEMVKLYDLNHDDKLTDQEIEWMKKGSTDEDQIFGGIKQIRSANHFYNPLGIKGWVDGTNKARILSMFDVGKTSKQWAHDSVAQSEYIGGDFTWERAIWDYANNDKQHAYESLGHIMHLIEDATVPAHVRSDLHISPKEAAAYKDSAITQIFFDFEPYEGWTGSTAYWKDLNLDFSKQLFQKNQKTIIFNSLDEYFDNVAGYTNKNFFSKDTIYAYPAPLNYSSEGSEKINHGDVVNYVYGFDNNGEKFKLARVSKDGYTSKKLYVLDDDSSEIHSDYWSHLAPKAILAGAGIINLFKTEAEKAKNNPSSIQKPPTAVSYYIIDPINKKADEIKSSAVAFYDYGKTSIGNASGMIGKFFNSSVISVSSYFTSSAKAQLVFDISNPLSQGMYSLEDIIAQSEKIPVAEAQTISEPAYSGSIQVLNQGQKTSFAPGEAIALSAEIKNTSTVIWQGDKISLNVYINRDLANKFYHSSWLTLVRPADLGKVAINPGATGTFNFIVTAPQSAGNYFFRVRPVWQDENNEFNWLGENIASWAIQVEAPKISTVKEEPANSPIENTEQVSETKKAEGDNSALENSLPPEEIIPAAGETIGKAETENEALAAAEAAKLEEEYYALRRKRIRAWVNTLPETAIVGFPENPTFETSASFKFSSTKPNSTFYCNLDDSEFLSCGENTEFKNLVLGAHLLKVKAKDEYGNYDETSAEYSWLINKAEIPPHLVISEIQAGTDKYGAEDEFVELYNPTDQTINLSGWELRKKNSSGIESNLVDNGDFNGSVAPKSFFLIAHKNYKGSVVPDLRYSTGNDLSYENNSLILYNADYRTGATIDEVVYSGIPKGQSLERKARQGGNCVSAQGKGEFLGNGCDTDDQSDFEIRPAPNPQNSASIAEPAATPVHNINSGFDYPTIQWAIDNANQGDEIQVDSGTYYENVKVNRQVILKGIDAGQGKPVVDAGGLGNAVTVSADGSTVEGFSAINSYKNGIWHSGIEVKSNNNSIKNNSVSSNYYGIYLENSNKNVLSGNTSDANAYDGIVLAHSSYNTIDNNIVSNSSYGIRLDDNSNFNALGNNIVKLNANAGLFIEYGYDNTLNSNILKSNAYGAFIFSGARNKFYHNNFIDNSQFNVDDRSGTANIWDDGYPGGGNYWSDYKGIDINNGENQDQSGSDGIGDSPYPIACNSFNTCGGVSYDRYPPMKPYAN